MAGCCSPLGHSRSSELKSSLKAVKTSSQLVVNLAGRPLPSLFPGTLQACGECLQPFERTLPLTLRPLALGSVTLRAANLSRSNFYLAM